MSSSKDKNAKTFFTVFQEAKEIFAEKNLTYREIGLNTGIAETYLRMVFNDNNNLVSNLSKIIEFANIRIKTTNKKITVYRIFDDGINIKITRVLEPRCSMYYVRKNQEYYKFEWYKKRFKENYAITKELIATEMHLEIQDYLDRNENKLRY